VRSSQRSLIEKSPSGKLFDQEKHGSLQKAFCLENLEKRFDGKPKSAVFHFNHDKETKGRVRLRVLTASDPMITRLIAYRCTKKTPVSLAYLIEQIHDLRIEFSLKRPRDSILGSSLQGGKICPTLILANPDGGFSIIENQITR
jgi:hypothetical protein